MRGVIHPSLRSITSSLRLSGSYLNLQDSRHLNASYRVQSRSAAPALKNERLHFIAQRTERANMLEHAAAQPTSDWHPDKLPVVGLCATRGGANLVGLKEKPINRPPSATPVTIKRLSGQMYHLVLIRQLLLHVC